MKVKERENPKFAKAYEKLSRKNATFLLTMNEKMITEDETESSEED